MADVKVYSTPSCPWCTKAKQFLEEKGVDFDYIDVTKDPEALKEMVEKSGQRGVPVLDVKGTIIVGFDKDAIEAALAE